MDSVVKKYKVDTGNPHLKLIKHGEYEQFIFDILKAYQEKEGISNLRVLDIGGGKGWNKLVEKFPSIEYHILDLHSSKDKLKFIQGDITSPDLQLPQTYHIIFTKDTFEHILNPWDATQNILQNLEEKGLFIFLAPFSWRYHASPVDTYRYSHTGARYLFERLGKLKNIFAGYIVFGPTNGFWKNNKDKTIDNQPFPKCLETIYIAQKDSAHVFSKDLLDTDTSWDHTS
jgi:hypothetical protein